MAQGEFKQRLERIGVLALATGGFVGFFPVASGTVGSAVGSFFAWGLHDLPLGLYIALCVLLGGMGVWACDRANHILRKPDASPIVIDEIVGVMVAMIGIPVTGFWLGMGFLLFRFFDIVKLPPADYADTHLKNGWGVMLDDVMAGIYTNILLRLMLRAHF